MKNKNIFNKWLIALFLSGLTASVTAQIFPTLEWNKDGRSTTDKGNLPNSPNPITSATVTFYKNTDNPSGQTFIATDVTATIELIQPYNSSYKNAFGLSYEAIGGSGNGYRPVAREIYSKQGGSAYTASPNVNSGTGISANDNYSLRTFFPIYPLFGQSSTGRFLIEKVKVTFSEPVDNPVFHIAGIGAYMESTGDGAQRYRKTYYSEWELADESLDLSVLSGNGDFGEFDTSNGKKGFTNTTIRGRGTTYSRSNIHAAGSVVVYGTGLTEVVFNVYMTSKINRPWNINAHMNNTTNGQSRVGEVIYFGVSFEAPCGVKDQKPVVNSISNSCPFETVNLNYAHTGTIPSGAELLWFTSATRDAGTQVSNTEAVEEGSYYAFYYESANDCWSLVSDEVIATIDDCADCTISGETSVDLNSLFTGTLPHPDVVLEWWTSPTKDLDPLNPGTKVDDPENVTESGTYYVFFYDTANDCYNTDNSTSFVDVNVLPPCICTQTGDFTLNGIPTKIGITTQKKQEAWPGSIPNGFFTLESREKGFVITRVAHVGGTDGTPHSTDAITDAKEGMLVYDIQDECVKLFNGTIWKCLERSCNE